MDILSLETNSLLTWSTQESESLSLHKYGENALESLKEYLDYFAGPGRLNMYHVDTLVHKYFNQQRHFIHFQAFLKIRHMWKVTERFPQMKALSTFITKWYKCPIDQVPVSNLVDHFLVCCLQLHRRFFHIFNTCITAWMRIEQLVALNHFAKLNLVCMTLVARFRALSKSWMNILSKTYTALLRVRSMFPTTRAKWLPETISLPLSIKLIDIEMITKEHSDFLVFVDEETENQKSSQKIIESTEKSSKRKSKSQKESPPAKKSRISEDFLTKVFASDIPKTIPILQKPHSLTCVPNSIEKMSTKQFETFYMETKTSRDKTPSKPLEQYEPPPIENEPPELQDVEPKPLRRKWRTIQRLRAEMKQDNLDEPIIQCAKVVLVWKNRDNIEHAVNKKIEQLRKNPKPKPVVVSKKAPVDPSKTKYELVNPKPKPVVVSKKAPVDPSKKKYELVLEKIASGVEISALTSRERSILKFAQKIAKINAENQKQNETDCFASSEANQEIQSSEKAEPVEIEPFVKDQNINADVSPIIENEVDLNLMTKKERKRFLKEQKRLQEEKEKLEKVDATSTTENDVDLNKMTKKERKRFLKEQKRLQEENEQLENNNSLPNLDQMTRKERKQWRKQQKSLS